MGFFEELSKRIDTYEKDESEITTVIGITKDNTAEDRSNKLAALELSCNDDNDLRAAEETRSENIKVSNMTVMNVSTLDTISVSEDSALTLSRSFFDSAKEFDKIAKKAEEISMAEQSTNELIAIIESNF